jgi:hypothetical protein
MDKRSISNSGGRWDGDAGLRLEDSVVFTFFLTWLAPHLEFPGLYFHPTFCVGLHDRQ